MSSEQNNKLTIKELALFAMLGAMMFVSKLVFDVLPNIHLLGVFTVAFTVVYRQKALIPIYIFVALLGVVYGFPFWWYVHLYTWTLLWGAVMLLPKNMSPKVAPIIYLIVNGLHGFLYGVLYVPVQLIFFGSKTESIWLWLLQGIPFDLTHGISNLICGSLIMPIVLILKKAERFAR